MLNRDYIGYSFAPRHVDIEKGQLRLFARAIGETNPVYFDEAAARAAGHPAIPAPLTFGYCLKDLAQATGGPSREELGIDYGRVLHGEQAMDFYKPIYAGDRITLHMTITDMYEKKGGALEFIVMHTLAENQRGELVQSLRTVGIMRNG